MNESVNEQEIQPVPILGITTSGHLLIPPGLKQFEILTLMQAFNQGVKKVLDNLTVQ